MNTLKKKKKMLHLSDGVSMRASSLTTNLNEDCVQVRMCWWYIGSFNTDEQ